MAFEITKTLFNDNMVLKCGKFYKDGIKKAKKNLGQADGGHIF